MRPEQKESKQIAETSYNRVKYRGMSGQIRWPRFNADSAGRGVRLLSLSVFELVCASASF